MSISSILNPNNLTVCSSNLVVGNIAINNDFLQKPGTTFTTSQLATAINGGGPSGGNISGILTAGTFPIATASNTIADSSITNSKAGINIAENLTVSAALSVSSVTTLNSELVMTGPIVYNSNNSAAGSDYFPMTPLYEYEYILTSTGCPANTDLLIPYPNGKTPSSIKKLSVSLLLKPENIVFLNDQTYNLNVAYTINATPANIVIHTYSTWTQLGNPLIFSVYITTN